MAKRIPDEELQAIEAVARAHPDGISASNIAAALKTGIPHRTLQYRLKYLVDENRLVRKGGKRAATYWMPVPAAQQPEAIPAGASKAEAHIPVSKTGAAIQNYVRKPIQARQPVGYARVS